MGRKPFLSQSVYSFNRSTALTSRVENRPLKYLVSFGLLIALVSSLLLWQERPAEAAGLKVRLSNNADGTIHVDWDDAAGKNVTYKVQTALNRAMTVKSELYTVPAGQTWLDVPPGDLVTPASGDYTFVKLRIYRAKPGVDGSAAAVWIKPTVITPPTSGSRLKIATFNVLIWGAIDKKKKSVFSWTVRRQKIVKSVRQESPDVLMVQETSGAPRWKVAGKRHQFIDLAKHLPAKYRLTARGLYLINKKVGGSQGSRIFYNFNKYRVLDTGYLRLPAVSKNIRWAPWALLRDRKTGEEFYVASAHLQSKDDQDGTLKNFNLRLKQTRYLNSSLTKLANSGRAVYLGGDLNSTNGNLAGNEVHRILIAAGWYDAFATDSLKGENYPTTNGSHFPVKPGAYRRDYILSLGAPQGSYYFENHFYNRLSLFQSDHFMQSAAMPVQPGPYGPRATVGKKVYR